MPCPLGLPWNVMSEKQNQELPYKPLGTILRRMREQKQQSLAEVSGAVEIDISALTDIEQGRRRPSEDILHLLISHFGVKEEEAIKMWELAGYTSKPGYPEPGTDENVQPVFVMPMDVRIVYTDMVHVMVNNHGVVMNFMQSAGPGNKPLAVSRIGMSREHAESVLALLQKALQKDQPKLLPEPKSDTETP